MNQGYPALYKKLGYEFKSADNLTLALTHRSASKQHNERLEFLGDAVLGMIIANALFERFPNQPEGKLTRMRASLVKGDTLAELGKEFELGSLLKLGPGEMKSGGARRASTLADAVEAIIGAIYLESGLAVCQPLVLRWFARRIEALNPEQVLKDDKTRLQEFLQARRLPLPDYQVVEIKGEDHNQTFVVSCAVTGVSESIIGHANSRRKAEQAAARQALEALTDGN